MIFIFLFFFRELFGLNANHPTFVPDILNGMETLENNFGLIQPRFNASCDEESLEAAMECEARFRIFRSNSLFFLRITCFLFNRCRPKPAFYAGNSVSPTMREVIYFWKPLSHSFVQHFLPLLLVFFVLL